MEWITEGFEGFSRGSFGNGGQNLYVSKHGILQRIFQYDLNGDGKVTEADLEKLIGLIDGNYSLGDVNHSGTVDDADAELLYQFLQGNGTKEEADALGLDLDVANLNRDDRVDWNDYDSLMQYIAQ